MSMSYVKLMLTKYYVHDKLLKEKLNKVVQMFLTHFFEKCERKL